MKRFALPILVVLIIAPAALQAQLPYQGYGGYQGGSPYGLGSSPYGGYYPGPNSYGPAPQRFPAALGLLPQNGSANFANRYLSQYSNSQNLQYTQNYYGTVLRNPSIGPPPPGVIEEDPFATLPQAGHYAGYNNTLGYYPLNGRTTSTVGQKPNSAAPAKKAQQ